MAMHHLMAIGARPHVSGVINVCLNSGGQFMLCLVYIPCLVLTLVSGDKRLALSIGPNRVGFYPRTETDPVSETLVFNKNWKSDNAQEVNYCINVHNLTEGRCGTAVQIDRKKSTACSSLVTDKGVTVNITRNYLLPYHTYMLGR
jgi:hypothetical protein